MSAVTGLLSTLFIDWFLFLNSDISSFKLKLISLLLLTLYGLSYFDTIFLPFKQSWPTLFILSLTKPEFFLLMPLLIFLPPNTEQEFDWTKSGLFSLEKLVLLLLDTEKKSKATKPDIFLPKKLSL